MNPKLNKRLAILGIRGIPARHGGFETFAEQLAVYLQQKGWQVTVYCQQKGRGKVFEDYWYGIHRIHVPIFQEGAKGTVIFDWKSTRHAAASKNNVLILTLGYNTALFTVMYRLKGIKNIINMDGMEWQRDKWNSLERCWLYLNEKVAAILGNHLIADHPEIKKHLSRFIFSDKISVIPYGADILESADHDQALLSTFRLIKKKYCLLIARPEQENSILEIVKAYSMKQRGIPLVILGHYNAYVNEYHRKVINAAGHEIIFLGAIYQKKIVQGLRFFAKLYIHGHTVGGTNPSLIEALGAASAILAHDNKFNRWVAGNGAWYFSTVSECSEKIEQLISDTQVTETMKRNNKNRAAKKFKKNIILNDYETLLDQFRPQ